MSKKIHGNWVRKRLKENELEVKVIEAYSPIFLKDKDFREIEVNEINLNIITKYESNEDGTFNIIFPHVKYQARIKSKK